MERRYFATAILIVSLTVSVCLADEALVGYWAFEEGEGEDAKDLSGLGNDGVIMGKTEWMQGKFGAALAFFKDGQGYVEIVDNETLDIADQITMTAWIKPSDIYRRRLDREKLHLSQKESILPGHIRNGQPGVLSL